MGDGFWYKICSRIVLDLNNFQLNEVVRIENNILSKYKVSSYLIITPQLYKDRVYGIKNTFKRSI